MEDILKIIGLVICNLIGFRLGFYLADKKYFNRKK